MPTGISPTIVGSLSINANCIDVEVEGDFAYISATLEGLYVVNVSNPSNPLLVNNLTTYYPSDIDIAGDYAYTLLSAHNIFEVLDISNASNPYRVGGIFGAWSPRKVRVEGDYAYVAGSQRLQVINIADPLNPYLAGEYNNTILLDVLDLEIAGNYAYLTCGGNGLQVINITNPLNPTLVGSVDTEDAKGITLAGDYGYISDNDSLLIADISDPATPSLVGNSIEIDNIGSHSIVEGDFAYIGGSNFLYIVDISIPINPILVEAFPSSIIGGLDIVGDYIFSVAGYNGLHVIQISERVSPTIVGFNKPSGYTNDLEIAGDYAYVANADGFRVMDITDPINPSLVATCFIPGIAVELALAGDYAFIAAWDGGLQVIDISNPTNPVVVGSRVTPGRANDVKIDGDYAYVVDDTFGLHVMNITIPSNPVIVGNYNPSAEIFGVVISGEYAYLANHLGGVYTINIANPSTPTFTGFCNTPYSCEDIVVAGDYAYVASHQWGLQVINVTDPTSPLFADDYDTPNISNGLTIDGDFIYIADWEGGLQVFNVTQPTNVGYVSNSIIPGETTNVKIAGDYAYIASQLEGIQVIEIKRNRQRQFRSNATAQSTTVVTAPVNTTLIGAILSSNTDMQLGSTITYHLSVDNGQHWEEVSLDNPHSFIYIGTELQWKAIFTTIDPFNGSTLSSLSINYKYVYNSPFSLVPQDGGFSNSGQPFFEWDTYADVIEYLFQLDSESSFTPPDLLNETTSLPSFMPSLPLADGIWYWRVAAIDSQGDLGLFSAPNSLLIDTTSPNIDQPDDISYEQGSTDNNITWSPSDVTPTYYNITRNGELVVGDYWDGSDILLNIDGLARGSYTYVCNVYDYFYTQSSDTVIVTVYDTSSPIIDSPVDIDYEESSTNNIIIWTVTDYNPNYFNVTLDGEFYVDGVWDIDPIKIDIDGLAWGTYTFNCFVYDLDWNKANDSVQVSVLDITPPIINNPSNLSIFYGDFGESLLWTGFDVYPSNFTVYRNGSLYKKGEWVNTVFIWLDSLDLGVHNFTCIVTDKSGLTASSEVWVTVQPPIPDVDPPTISHPEDFLIEEGSIGYSIIWSGSDSRSPWWATVTQNGTIIYDQAWFGNEIIISLDGLPLGRTVYNCTLFDETGNSIFDIVNITVHPQVPDYEPPLIVTPEFLEYEEGTEGHYMTWICHDDHPYAYRILFNNTEVVYAPWYGGNISICVDGLTIGLWYINLTIWDLEKNNNSATVLLTVIPSLPDEKSPIASQPAVQNIGEGVRGTIIWEVSDEYPANYIVSRNGSLVFQSSYWESGLIRYSFNSLSIGTWLFNLTLWDQSGNSASSIAIVVVVAMSELDTTAPEISQPPDQEFNLGSTGNSLQFHLFDEHPSYYKILLNNHQILKTQWITPNLQVNISLDELSIGLYTVNLIAWDLYENTASRTVTVTVIGDITPPTINSPPDVSISEGEDIEIVWEASDPCPSHFVIVSIPGGEVIANQTWDGQSATFIFSNLTVGSYGFRCIVYDTFGNLAFDDITITIIKSQSSAGFDILSVVILLLVYFSVIRTVESRRRFKK